MRGLVFLVVAGCGRIAFDPTTDASAGPAGPRTPLLVERATDAEELVDVPLLVTLDASRFSPELAGAAFESLAFTDARGGALPFEIESTTPTLRLWVRATLGGGTTRLYIVYRPLAVSEPVFGPAYEAVWHLGDPAASIRDATTHGHDGTVSATSRIGGFIGDAHRFVRADGSHVRIPDAASLAFDQLTISGWKNETTTSTFRAIIGRQLGTGNRSDFWIGSSGLFPMTQVATGGIPYAVMSQTSRPLASWYHTAATYDGVELRLYVDGQLAGSIVTPGGPVDHSGGDTFISADCDGTGTCPNVDFNDAILDEVRLERVARSPAWIAFDVAAMRDEVITYGTLEP